MMSLQCYLCKHYWGSVNCDAFPDKEIPAEILEGETDHDKKHPDQKNEVVFEPLNDMEITE